MLYDDIDATKTKQTQWSNYSSFTRYNLRIPFYLMITKID